MRQSVQHVDSTSRLHDYVQLKTGLLACAVLGLDDEARCASFAPVSSEASSSSDSIEGDEEALGYTCATLCDEAGAGCVGFGAIAHEKHRRGCWLYSQLNEEDVKRSVSKSSLAWREHELQEPRADEDDHDYVDVVRHVKSVVCVKAR